MLTILKMLESPVLLDATRGTPQFVLYRNKLRKLALKHVYKYDILPSALFLRDVRRIDNKQYGAGAFSDVFCGMYHNNKVALKKLRVPESEKQKVKKASNSISHDAIYLTVCICRRSIWNPSCGKAYSMTTSPPSSASQRMFSKGPLVWCSRGTTMVVSVTI